MTYRRLWPEDNAMEYTDVTVDSAAVLKYSSSEEQW